MRFPRRCAILSAHLLSAPVSGFFVRNSTHVASTRTYRARLLPALVIFPRWHLSPKLSSFGTKPRQARTLFGVAEPTDLIQRRHVRHRRDGADPGHAAQPVDGRIVFHDSDMYLARAFGVSRNTVTSRLKKRGGAAWVLRNPS